MFSKIKETAEWIKAHTALRPTTAIVLGTGLGHLANEIEIVDAMPYSDIPNFPVSTVEGHSGQLLFGRLGGKAIGLCGKDAGLLEVVKKPMTKDGVDLGFVGNITKVNVKLLQLLSADEYIPVIAPVGVDKEGQSYNINADTVASEIASALKAEKLMFLTDIDGIRMDPADPRTLISAISVSEIDELISSGVITGGMIPKVQGCVNAVQNGVNRVHILDGTIPHPIILEIFTDKGIGTMVHAG